MRGALPCLLLVASACQREDPVRVERLAPSVSAMKPPALDAGVPFDFRWARIDETHVGAHRLCQVTRVSSRASLDRRSDVRYGGRRFSARATVGCRTPDGEAYVDLVFPPSLRAFESQVRSGAQVDGTVLAAHGGFDDLSVVEFVSVTEGPPLDVRPFDPIAVGPAHRFRSEGRDAVRVGDVRTCAIVWASDIGRIAQEQAERFPRGASHLVSVACRTVRGDDRVDVVATPRAAADLLTLRAGARVRLTVVAVAGGAADAPLAVVDAASVRPPEPTAPPAPAVVPTRTPASP